MPRSTTGTITRIVALSCLLSMPVVLTTVGTVAVAQSNGTKSGGLPPAPVGHRQPTQSGLAQSGVKENNDALAADADDKALDKKIKSICRGC